MFDTGDIPLVKGQQVAPVFFEAFFVITFFGSRIVVVFDTDGKYP